MNLATMGHRPGRDLPRGPISSAPGASRDRPICPYAVPDDVLDLYNGNLEPGCRYERDRKQTDGVSAKTRDFHRPEVGRIDAGSRARKSPSAKIAKKIITTTTRKDCASVKRSCMVGAYRLGISAPCLRSRRAKVRDLAGEPLQLLRTASATALGEVPFAR